MSWLKLQGHDDVAASFRSALGRDRLTSTLLFIGPGGIGKRLFAEQLAEALLCERRDERLLDPCGECPACKQVLAGTHPDYLAVSRPNGKSFIPLGLLKGDEPEYPVSASLLFNLALRPYQGGRKVAVIDDADYLTQEGANCLLKTLEEPPPRSVLILISTTADRQLPTIRSRSQIVRFRPLAESVVRKLLIEQGVTADPNLAARLAALSGGSLSRATELADPQYWSFRRDLLTRLPEWPLPSVGLARMTTAFVDQAGKEAPPRRARLRIAIGIFIEFFRQLVLQLAGSQATLDPELGAALLRAGQQGDWSIESATNSALRSLEALNQLDKNANQQTLVETWLDDLLSHGQRQTNVNAI